MRLVSVLENKSIEKRIAVTPETAKKYISLGIDVTLQEGYGKHLGFYDSFYKDLGTKKSLSKSNTSSAAARTSFLGP